MRAKTKHGWRSAAARGLAGVMAVLVLAGGPSLAADPAPAAGQAPEQDQDEVSRIVSVGPQGYTVAAAQANVVQVLTEVGQHAGFTVEAPDDFNSPLTTSMQDVPLDQLLRRVLRNENYIIVYRGGVRKAAISGEQIDKIFLLSPAPGSGGGPAAGPGGSPLAGPAGPGQRPGPPGRNPPPPPPPPPGMEADNDLAARSALARARAEARRNGMPDGPMPTQPGAPGVMPEAARMVQNHDGLAPQPMEEPDAPGHSGIPAVDVPPNDEGHGGDDGGGGEEY